MDRETQKRKKREGGKTGIKGGKEGGRRGERWEGREGGRDCGEKRKDPKMPKMSVIIELGGGYIGFVVLVSPTNSSIYMKLKKVTGDGKEDQLKKAVS